MSIAQPVLRICASHAELPRADCVVPERCVERACQRCRTPVHYDPQASIPFLGTEVIVCGPCAYCIAGQL